MKSSKAKKGGLIGRSLPWLIGFVLVGAIGYGLKPKPLAVETAAITRGELVVSVIEEGKTRIRHRHVISPPIAGFLRRVELRAGAPIKRGETVLAVIEASTSAFLDPRTRAEAEARINASTALRETRMADLGRSDAALGLALKQLERQEKLLQSGASAVQEYDIAVAEEQVRRREKNAAEFALRAAESDVELARAALLQAQAPSADQAKPITILAPIDGFVLNIYEESARPVTPGLAIMEVGDPQDLEAEIELLSSDAAGVAPGAEVSIEQWGGEQPLRGKVTLVEPGGFTKISSLGVEEQRVKTRVDFLDPVPAGHLLGDRFRVEARIVTWKNSEVLLIPTGALFRRGNTWMTYREENGVAREAKLEIGRNNGVFAQVVDGLKEGDRVILHPPDPVKDGLKVKIE